MHRPCAHSVLKKGGRQGTLDFFLLNFWLLVDRRRCFQLRTPCSVCQTLTNSSKPILTQLALLKLSGSQTQTSRQSVEDLREAVQVDGVFGDGGVNVVGVLMCEIVKE